MNGFKDGASSDDPYSGDDDDGGDGGLDQEGEDDAAVATDGVDERPGSQSVSEPDQSPSAGGGLPWLYRRSSITDGREKTVQLHLQSSSLDAQRDALADVESQLGESVNKADLREAAFLVGLRHLDEVAATLREWGYDVE